MRRWIIYVLILAGAIWLNHNKPGGREVTALEPVETLRISGKENAVQIETDTGRVGVGTDIRAAVEDMAKRADKEVFLDTAEYLLVREDGLKYLDQMIPFLCPTCKICIEKGITDIRSVAGYLDTHKPKVSIRVYQAEKITLPELIIIEERMNLAQ